MVILVRLQMSWSTSHIPLLLSSLSFLHGHVNISVRSALNDIVAFFTLINDKVRIGRRIKVALLPLSFASLNFAFKTTTTSRIHRACCSLLSVLLIDQNCIFSPCPNHAEQSAVRHPSPPPNSHSALPTQINSSTSSSSADLTEPFLTQ